MVHNHPVYDADPHFTIDAVTRAITNESGKTILMQYDHDSERFSFEINRLIEGHDVTLCNKVEVHYTNTDSNRQGINYGVYEVDDLIVDPNNNDRVVFTWLVSKNATLYSGSLNFLIVFTCVEDNVVVYRWNTNINNSVSIAKGMNNGEAVVEEYPDILAQWKDELFAAATGTNSISVGPVEPTEYPYIWLDTSVNLGKEIGILTVKNGSGIKSRMYPIVKMSGVEGLEAYLKLEFQKIATEHAKDIEEIESDIAAMNLSFNRQIDNLESILTGAEAAIAHSLTDKGVDVPDDMSIQDVAALIDGITMDVPTALQSISITTPPNVTDYCLHEAVDTEGMVVTADFGDGVTVPVECYTISPTVITDEIDEVTVSLTVNGVTKTATYSITVTAIVASSLEAGSMVAVSENDLTETWYRIVDTDYYGNILLVREELISDTSKFRASVPSYSSSNKYEDSALDTYLNETFYENLPASTMAIIQPVDIPVRSSAHVDATQEYLTRHVFALSATEWGKSSENMEGEPVEYTDCMIASANYWTRQPSAGMAQYAYQIRTDGTCNSAMVTSSNGVRPAFCIAKNQSMREVDGGWAITNSATENLLATLFVDDEGNGTISGITFAVDSDGNATIG